MSVFTLVLWFTCEIFPELIHQNNTYDKKISFVTGAIDSYNTIACVV